MKNVLLILCATTLLCSCKSQLITSNAELKLVSDTFEFTEGPAVDKNGDVFFTDQPNNRIVKWTAATNTVEDYMKPAGRSNGLYFDHNGDLLSCADEKTALWRIDADKKVTVLVDQYNGKKLGGPNDLWVDPNGGIYFTDPFYARPWWDYKEPEFKERRVYYRTPKTHEIKIAAENFVNPNGIIGSADGSKLYIADIKAKITYVFDVAENGVLTNKKLFANMGSDGMTIDSKGNVYLTGDGVTVFDKKGTQVLHIPVPEKWTANVTFGGPLQNILFITAMDSVYTLEMDVNGVR